MNIYHIIGVLAAGGFFLIVLLAFLAVHRTNKDMADWIKWLRQQLAERDVTIKELNDRLMAKSLDQFKLWQPTPEAGPPPVVEEEIDDSPVGQISGQERVANAGNES